MLRRANARKLVEKQENAVKQAAAVRAQELNISDPAPVATVVSPVSPPKKSKLSVAEILQAVKVPETKDLAPARAKGKYTTIAFAVAHEEVRAISVITKRLRLTTSEWCRRLIMIELKKIMDEGRAELPSLVFLGDDVLDNLRGRAVKPHKRHVYFK